MTPDEMINSIWTEWERCLNELKTVVLTVRDRILAKAKSSACASNRLPRIDATCCAMISLQVIMKLYLESFQVITCSFLMKRYKSLELG